MNLNGYYLFINGTLRAIGSASDKIQISGGDITFGSSDQTGSISRFENAAINSTISTNKPLTVNNNIIDGGVSVTSSTISNNIISGGGPFTDWGGRPQDATFAVTTYGDSSVSSNAISSSTGGFGILIRTGHTSVSGNVISN